ncbi:hypothetical protein [Streptomyces parvus]|uniref:hypothetical protein n=1 Tax=Streptomyces parvus TaxID=66428 RepID=UPI0021008D94|nr:hypothetical protein [Streptomyces parvus]MCQ1579302.1 hypothetical protein [Streptomyces parvus]
MTRLFTEFPKRIADITTQLTTQGIPLTAPVTPAAPPDPDAPWGSSHPAPPVDRTTLAWCTAVQMLADHHHTAIEQQVLAADALIRELGVRGLTQLHSDLHRGAPIDYRFTRCPYCSGLGEDPTLPDCRDVGCPPRYEFTDHAHICPVCRGEDYEPEWVAEERITELDRLLDTSLGHGPRRVSWYQRLAQNLRRRR